ANTRGRACSPEFSSSALSVSSAVVSERFVNFLPNFAPQFPEKDVEEARDRCRIHGIGFEFFDIPTSFPGIPVSTRLRKEPDAVLSMWMKVNCIYGTRVGDSRNFGTCRPRLKKRSSWLTPA